MNSIRFKLIVWFAGLLVLVTLAFGAYAYTSLERFLTQVLKDALQHRVEQITAMVAEIPKAGEPPVAAEIEARFAPGRNDKLVRVTRADGVVVYLSGAPTDHSFDPSAVPVFHGGGAMQTRRESAAESDLLVSSEIVKLPATSYTVEVGASLAPSARVLHALLLTLLGGLPVLAALAVLGGLQLIKSALLPVQNIMGAAQEITLHHLSRRLPVPNTRDEIANLSIVLNQMIARLDESFQASSRFTADASHELRTPLTIMRGELEVLLLRRDLDPEVRDHLTSLHEEIERLVRIVEGLFALSRLDTGEAQTERVRVDLANLAETTAEQMCLLAEEKKISLVCETKERVDVEGDRARLKQIVVNLLDNAIKYTPVEGEVSIRVSTKNGSALLEVADTGPGVPAAAIPHLFERFYRADEVRSRNIGGAGLGLSIVQSICTAHGGNISAANLSPKGSRFTVELPLAQRINPQNSL
ncbi:MAG TPA: ATP-binding protein [Chthoniobacteraceae bacterium]|jgi:heavy metal sensor kinase